MAFNIKTWQAQTEEHLRNWKNWMVASGIDSIYATLATSALWPLAQALVSEPFAAVTELMKLLGGVGTNLLANKVQAWKDKSPDHAVQEIALELQREAPEQPELRREIDAVLQKLEVLQLAQQALPAAGRKWCEETLRGELERLGNVNLLQGSGSIVSGAGAKGAGAGGVVGENFEDTTVITGPVDAGGDFTAGDKTEVRGTGNIVTSGHVIFAEQGARVIIGEQPAEMHAVDRASALGRYLEHMIARNRYLQLQGIRSGGRLVNIELEHIYIALRATQQRTVAAAERWLTEEALLAPGEGRKQLGRLDRTATETVTVNFNQALAEHQRLVVLGDPGSGKTTLLRYLALLYARDLAEAGSLVRQKLGLAESATLPILLPLRQIGTFLRTRDPAEDGTEGHARLLKLLLESLRNERITLPGNFFDGYLKSGEAVILLDGLDEVADPDLRRRVSRLVEAFVQAYGNCRFVVTSRIVGYTGAARLGENFVTTTVQDFAMADVERFLNDWHRLVAVGQMGPGPSAETHAREQTRQLLEAIRKNDRIRELAINPLMLTVIALVHRDRVKLPDRRAELYGEAVDVLLGKWDEARGVREIAVLPDHPFDTGDKRLMLQSVALHLHERKLKEIGAAELRTLLRDMFSQMLRIQTEVEAATSRFLLVIEERTGLLAARGEGVYAFSHLTFQEYLAALAVSARDDYVEYTLTRLPEEWWREVILLEAGCLSIQSKERTTRLIQAMADHQVEPERYFNLVLAAECLRDVGSNRVLGELDAQVQKRLHRELETPPPRGRLGSVQILLTKGMTPRAWAERRRAATRALSRVGGSTYWSLPHGEPQWIHIPAGEFWLGSEKGDEDEKPQQRHHLNEFLIARVPVTNAQYQLFVEAARHKTPEHWVDGRPPKGKESHPVTRVTWHDAMAYCHWLSTVTGNNITLPSEAEWEKAARGDQDKREYPWGDQFDPTSCNCGDLGLEDTTPVGIFPAGASPFGVLDMAGNVWEWCRTKWRDSYKHPADDSLAGNEARVLRGGAFNSLQWFVRCAFRYRNNPGYGNYNLGFRVLMSPLF